MTSYFSWLADDLTEIEERLAEPDLAPYSGPLRRAINRAFALACEADRAQRLATAATPQNPRAGPRPEANVAAESRSFAESRLRYSEAGRGPRRPRDPATANAGLA